VEQRAPAEASEARPPLEGLQRRPLPSVHTRYNSHRESAHFKKYAKATKEMIVSRKLIDTVPVQLSEKKK
jgi:hypothetical protein